jgi:hypothetical protein
MTYYCNPATHENFSIDISSIEMTKSENIAAILAGNIKEDLLKNPLDTAEENVKKWFTSLDTLDFENIHTEKRLTEFC